METINPKNVKLPPGAEYIRAIVDKSYVAELAQGMARGWPDAMPPIVLASGNDALVIDGVNRVLAARAAGLKAVPVTVRAVAKDEDTFVTQVVLNSTHGRRFTPTEREHIIRALRAKRWRDVKIADLLHLSAASVSRIARGSQAQVAAGRRHRRKPVNRARRKAVKGGQKAAQEAAAKVPEDKALLIDFLDGLYRVLTVWSEHREALQPGVLKLDATWASLLRSLANTAGGE